MNTETLKGLSTKNLIISDDEEFLGILTQLKLKEGTSGESLEEVNPINYDAKNPHHKAKALGLTLVQPTNYHILLDIDDDSHESVFKENYEILQETCPGFIQDIMNTTSKSGKKHYYIKLHKPYKPIARIGLQSVLGSDRKRDVLSIVRYIQADMPKEDVTVLFETEDGIKRLKETGWMNEDGKLI